MTKIVIHSQNNAHKVIFQCARKLRRMLLGFDINNSYKKLFFNRKYMVKITNTIAKPQFFIK